MLRWSIRHLLYVSEAGKLGSIAAAAERLDVSQSAVSGAINNIEDAFGVRLFQRMPGRGLRLTPSGSTMLAQIQQLMDEARKLEETAALLSTRLSGTIRLGCFPTAVPHVVPALMEALRKRYPAISLELQEDTISDLSERLLTGDLDVALSYDLERDRRIAFEPLFPVYQHVAMSAANPLTESETISLRQLVDKPMILLDLPVCRERILSAYHALGLEPRIHFKTASTSVVEQLVASGQGYSMLAFRPQPGRFGSPQIRFLRLEEQLPEVVFGMATVVDAKPSRAKEAFLDMIRTMAPGWSFS